MLERHLRSSRRQARITTCSWLNANFHQSFRAPTVPIEETRWSTNRPKGLDVLM